MTIRIGSCIENNPSQFVQEAGPKPLSSEKKNNGYPSKHPMGKVFTRLIFNFTHKTYIYSMSSL